MSIKSSLTLQYMMGKATSFVLGAGYFAYLRLMGYRVRDVKRIRRECAEQLAKHKGPWLMCANHLTMIDSLIVTYAMFSLGLHMRNFSVLPWSLPERRNFQKNIFLTVLCYLAKCIPVDRGGTRESMKKVLDQCTYLLNKGQNLQIFPEGGRSRTGYVNVESYTYGVGRFVENINNCRIMCIYARGDHQETYGSIPVYGEHFTVRLDVLEPVRVEYSGLRAQREYAGQIVKHLAKMEEEYFASHRQRRCRSDQPSQQGENQGSTVCQPRFHAQ